MVKPVNCHSLSCQIEHLRAYVDAHNLSTRADDWRSACRNGTGSGAKVKDALSVIQFGATNNCLDDGRESAINLSDIDIRHPIPYADLPLKSLSITLSLHHLVSKCSS